MHISEVIDYTIMAIFSNPKIAQKVLLKGGTALRLLEGIDIRLSTDLDLSVEKNIDSADSFFLLIERMLINQFKKINWDVIDFVYKRKPKKRNNLPDWWSGWLCTFKLSSFDKRGKSKSDRSRSAIIPVGSNTSVIEIEISEYEYCKPKHTKIISGIRVHGYSRELLVLEKIRALCQQHPSYELTSTKSRTRDFVDIYFLTMTIDDDFIKICREHLAAVFEAKKVPLTLLEVFWDDNFIDIQRRGLSEVQDTSKEALKSFDVYLENLRYIVTQIKG